MVKRLMTSVVATSIVLTVGTPIVMDNTVIEGKAAAKKLTEKELVAVATKKGEVVTKNATAFKKATETGNLTKIQTKQKALKTSIASYKKYLTSTKITKKNKTALTKKYINANQKILTNVDGELKLVNKLTNAKAGLEKQTYNNAQKTLENLKQEADTTVNIRKVKKEAKVATNFSGIFKKQLNELNEQIKINEEVAQQKLAARASLLKEKKSAFELVIKNAETKKVISAYENLAKERDTYKQEILKATALSSKTKEKLIEQYITQNTSSVTEASVNLVKKFNSTKTSLINLSYDDSQKKIEELKKDVSEQKVIIASSDQDGFNKIYEDKIKELNEQAISNEQAAARELEAKATTLRNARTTLTTQMNNGNYANLNSLYNKIKTEYENYKKLVDENNKISADTKAKFKVELNETVKQLNSIVKEKNIAETFKTAEERLKIYDYAEAKTAIQKSMSAVANGKTYREQKKYTDLPTKLTQAMNSKIQKLKDMYEGNLYFDELLNIQGINLEGDYRSGITLKNEGDNGIYEFDYKYRNNYLKSTKITMDVEMTADALKKILSGTYYDSVGFGGNSSVKLKPQTQKQQITIMLPTKDSFGGSFTLYFSSIKGITYSNMKFKK